MLNSENWLLLLIVVIVILELNYVSLKSNNSSSEETLILTHVIFRHGHRTPDLVELYPTDPFINETFFPVGHGQLTKKGKQQEFFIGKNLRQRYNKFLGKYYYPDIVKTLSTNYQRTKMSLQLVLAGLFPPNEEELWDQSLQWQPIPYDFFPIGQDMVLSSTYCPYYIKLHDIAAASKPIQKQIESHKKYFEYLTYHTGLNITQYLDVYNLYFGLSTEDEFGFILPKWTKPVWPGIITELAIKEYFVTMSTPELRQIAIGFLIEKIIKDTKKEILRKNKHGTKMYLYSGHENNIAHLLIGLDIFHPHIPKYGAYLIVEVHNIKNVYGIKVYYENYEDKNGPKLLKIPLCQEFCPLEDFFNIVKDLIPIKKQC